LYTGTTTESDDRRPGTDSNVPLAMAATVQLALTACPTTGEQKTNARPLGPIIVSSPCMPAIGDDAAAL